MHPLGGFRVQRQAKLFRPVELEAGLAQGVVALLGAYFMLRVKSSRKYGLFWLTMWVVYALGRAALGFIRGNPDALAYLMLSYAAIAVFAIFAIGVLLSALAEAVPNRPRLAPVLAIAALALGCALAGALHE